MAKENSKNNVKRYNKSTLKRALNHLLKARRKRVQRDEKQNCKLESECEARIDQQVKLRCRQLPQVVQELRKTVMRQDWNETATLVMILCHPGLKLYSSLIIKICYLLLFSHPKSNLELVYDFVRSTTGYILDEDIYKFIRILFTLRKSPLKPLEKGKYERLYGPQKVTNDPDFDRITTQMFDNVV